MKFELTLCKYLR